MWLVCYSDSLSKHVIAQEISFECSFLAVETISNTLTVSHDNTVTTVPKAMGDHLEVG